MAMRALGFRCFPDGFAYAVIEGTRKEPIFVAQDHLDVPVNAPRGSALCWVRKQVTELLTRYGPDAVSLKRAETSAKSKSLERSELEGVIKECVFASTKRECSARLKSQLAKMFPGFTQPARYLTSVLDAHKPKVKTTKGCDEAAIVALADLPEE
jgi:hypothetical protein